MAEPPSALAGRGLPATFLRQAPALELRSEAARDSLKHDLVRIEEWGKRLLNDPSHTGAVSVTLFTCTGADLWVEFPSPLPFENEFSIGDRPALWQLACLDADHSNALVVLLDTYTARVCEVVLGGFLPETDFDIQAGESQNGWGHLRYQRQARGDRGYHYQEIAEYLKACIIRRPTTAIIFSGPQDVVASFQQILPAQVRGRIIDEVPLDMHDTHARILRVAQDTLHAYERQVAQESVRLLLDSAGRGGLGVLGLNNTLIALNAGLVHKLIINSDFRRAGWRCLDCDKIGSDQQFPTRCTVCNGSVMAVELAEAMISEALRADGLVKSVEPDPRLLPYEGVGALLRHR